MDLSTRYLGLALRNPIIASASPLTGDVGAIRQLEDSGAGAVVLPSLFEEQIRAGGAIDRTMLTSVGADSSPEAELVFSGSDRLQFWAARLPRSGRAGARSGRHTGDRQPQRNDRVRAGSITPGSSNRPAQPRSNSTVYRIASGPAVTGAEAEADCVALVKAVRTPGYHSRRRQIAPVFLRLRRAGAATRSCRRRRAGSVQPALSARYRSRSPGLEKRCRAQQRLAKSGLGLLWLPFCPGRLPRASLAAGTGVETADEVIKYLLAGADAVMTTSALLRHGPGHLRSLVAGLETWLSARGFASVDLHQRLDAGVASRIGGGVQTNAPPISRVYRAIRALMSATDRRYGCFCATLLWASTLEKMAKSLK